MVLFTDNNVSKKTSKPPSSSSTSVEYIISEDVTDATTTSSSLSSGILSGIFYSRSTSQILDFFLDHKEFDYSPSEIAQKTGLSLRTVFREVPNLERYQLIYSTRMIGKTNMYILNSRNNAVEFLERFALEISQYHNNCNGDNDSSKSISTPSREDKNN